MRNNNRSGRRQYIYTRYLQRNVAYCTKSNLIQVKETFSYLSKKNKNPCSSLVRLSVIEPLKKKKKNPVIGPILPQLHNSNQKQKSKENKTEKNAPPWSSETHSPFNKTWPCTSTAPYRWNQWMMVWDNVTSRCTCQPFLSVARRQLCSA